ncbi:MAG: hypothetical protein IJ759_02785 [Bacteroidales bacterium]|nr:hypothetical protein [Bacteroidales bacterium]
MHTATIERQQNEVIKYVLNIKDSAYLKRLKTSMEKKIRKDNLLSGDSSDYPYKDMPIFGPKTLDEAMERLDEAEKQFAQGKGLSLDEVMQSVYQTIQKHAEFKNR